MAKSKITPEHAAEVLHESMDFLEKMRKKYGPDISDIPELVELESSLRLIAGMIVYDDLVKLRKELRDVKKELEDLKETAKKL